MIKKVVLIGGGASGMSCVARLRRLDEKLKIVCVEAGDEASYASCGMPYYIGGKIKDRGMLLMTPKSMLEKFYNFDMRLHTTLLEIILKEKQVKIKNLKTGKVSLETYDKLVLGMGARAFLPPIKGLQDCIKNDVVYVLEGMKDMDKIHDKAKWSKKCVVVGGGFVGLETAEQLKLLGVKEVTIVEMLPHVLPPLDLEMARIVEKEMKKNGITLMTGCVASCVEFLEDSDEVSVEVINLGTKVAKKLVVDFMLCSAGVRPRSDSAKKAGIKCSTRGHVEVNEHMQTSDANVFACGDLITCKHSLSGQMGYFPLANTANLQGRIVANFLYNKKPCVFKGAFGTSLVKIFSLTVSAIGLNEEVMKRMKMQYMKFYHFEGERPKYMPLETIPKNQSIKFMFNDKGKILGATIVGTKGVAVTANVISVAIHCEKSVQDIQLFELPYCPFSGHARSIIQQLGLVATGMIEKTHNPVYVEDVIDEKTLKVKEGIKLVDVRESYENRIFPRPDGAINIKLGQLRSKMKKFGKDDNIVFMCNIGKKAYWSSRVFTMQGFKNATFLSGSAFLFNRAFKK